ncbi:manganese efflux pump MntP family protein [Eubacteriales bacterium OttesenSCG-928-M02]|nr:manganese efflux pump MntP family protein [Eubacteriales bacterium OttesenSCG-928-M02]
MGLGELLLIAVGLSMDAFAVSICKGLELGHYRLKNAAIVGGYFGVFQAAMPLIGYFIGAQFAGVIAAYDHWIAFLLLAFIGGKMLADGLKKDTDAPMENAANALRMRNMLPVSLATSIDALAVGLTFAFLQVDVLPAITIIGITTLLLSMVGMKIGSLFGLRFRSQATMAGGVILILIGIKILVEHLGA